MTHHVGMTIVLVRPPDVGGAAAWQGLRLDGALVPVLPDVARSPAVADTPELRATALAPEVAPRAVVGGLSAAWVHCGGAPPRRLHVLYRVGQARPRPRVPAVVGRASLLADDVATVGGLSVTSVQRTGLDVARELGPDADLAPLVRLREAGFDVARARETVARRVRWHRADDVRRSLDRLEQLGAAG